MELMSVSEFTTTQRSQMLAMARNAITAVLNAERPDLPSVDALPDWLKPIRACFVTLDSHDRLRGCIGTLEPHRPLGQDIILNAVSAATRDYRFDPLQRGEPIRVSLSVLSPLTPQLVSSEAELVAVLQPEVDGVVLEAGEHRATFAGGMAKPPNARGIHIGVETQGGAAGGLLVRQCTYLALSY